MHPLAEAVRVKAEVLLAEAMNQLPHQEALASRVKRDQELWGLETVRLDPNLARVQYQALNKAREVLGVSEQVELHVRAFGGHQQAVNACVEPAIRGKRPAVVTYFPRTVRLLSLKEHEYLLGHELGHLVAGHVSTSSTDYDLARVLAYRRSLPVAASNEHRNLGFRFLIAAELTCDRLGLLVARDPQAAVRVDMTAVVGEELAGLPCHPDEFVAQASELVERTLAEPGAWLQGSTHPTALLRAYAITRFSRTYAYRELTGEGPADVADEEVEQELIELLRRVDAVRTERWQPYHNEPVEIEAAPPTSSAQDMELLWERMSDGIGEAKGLAHNAVKSVRSLFQRTPEPTQSEPDDDEDPYEAYLNAQFAELEKKQNK